jgi:cytochrome c-type biogenesis protein CcsB
VNLNELSILSLYSAMAVYALAFIAFAFDLAKRSAAVKTADEAAGLASLNAVHTKAGVLSAAAAAGTAPGRAGAAPLATATRDPRDPSGRAAGGASGGTIVHRISARIANDAATPYGRSKSLRIGVSLTVLAWAVHLVADVLRGFAAGRVPWANMYEFAMTGTLLIVTVFLIVLTRADLRFLGTFVTGMVLVLLGIAALRFYVEVAPLPPALQSAWLVIHVFVASLGTGFFALGFALSVVQLLQFRREALVASAGRVRLRFLATLPSAATLENLAYRVQIIGFILWTFTLMAGSIWAEKAWGRYWGWDTKEVWTFIIWTIYAGYIHARATRGWRGSRSAWLAIVGFSAVMFNFGVVNVFFKGLHAYSGL